MSTPNTPGQEQLAVSTELLMRQELEAGLLNRLGARAMEFTRDKLLPLVTSVGVLATSMAYPVHGENQPQQALQPKPDNIDRPTPVALIQTASTASEKNVIDEWEKLSLNEPYLPWIAPQVGPATHVDATFQEIAPPRLHEACLVHPENPHGPRLKMEDQFDNSEFAERSRQTIEEMTAADSAEKLVKALSDHLAYVGIDLLYHGTNYSELDTEITYGIEIAESNEITQFVVADLLQNSLPAIDSYGTPEFENLRQLLQGLVLGMSDYSPTQLATIWDNMIIAGDHLPLARENYPAYYLARRDGENIVALKTSHDGSEETDYLWLGASLMAHELFHAWLDYFYQLHGENLDAAPVQTDQNGDILIDGSDAISFSLPDGIKYDDSIDAEAKEIADATVLSLSDQRLLIAQRDARTDLINETLVPESPERVFASLYAATNIPEDLAETGMNMQAFGIVHPRRPDFGSEYHRKEVQLMICLELSSPGYATSVLFPKTEVIAGLAPGTLSWTIGSNVGDFFDLYQQNWPDSDQPALLYDWYNAVEAALIEAAELELAS